MKIIILMLLVVATGTSFAQTDIARFENADTCYIARIANLPDTIANPIIIHGGVYLEYEEDKLFVNLCYKIGGTIYGYANKYTLEDDILILGVPPGKYRNPIGNTKTILIALRFGEKDLAKLKAFMTKLPQQTY